MTALASPDQSTTPAPTRGPGQLLAPIAVGLLAAAAAYVIYRVFIGTELGQRVDSAAMRGGDVEHPRVTDILSRTLNGTTLVSLVLVCLVAATIGVLRKRLDLALGAGLLVLGANLSTQLLKMRLDRPDLDGSSMPNSFPSGHTAAAASVAFALILVLPHALRGMIALAGAGYATIIAIATVWAEWHRPSDTVAALLIVLAWGCAAVFLIRARRMAYAPERPSRLATFPLLLVGAIATTATLLGLAFAAMSEQLAPDLMSGRIVFIVGTAGITAVVAGVFLAWVRLAAGDQPTEAPLREA